MLPPVAPCRRDGIRTRDANARRDRSVLAEGELDFDSNIYASRDGVAIRLSSDE